jgi:hypothetical protein
LIEAALGDLRERFGPTDRISGELPFDRTRYYAREMGWPLHRRFVSFRYLVPPERLVEIKLETNRVEQRRLVRGDRRVNIDPGILSAERLVLATGKNYTHRIYLSRGIHADLTLMFQKGSFHPLPWTYPDYADPRTIQFFNEVREQYMMQAREKRGQGIRRDPEPPEGTGFRLPVE